MSNLQKIAFAVIIAAPLLLIAVTTFAFRQLKRLSHSAGVLQSAAAAMLTPDDSVIARSTIMAKSIQAQVDEVNMKVSSALNRMELLDDMVKSQSSSLSKSTIASETVRQNAVAAAQTLSGSQLEITQLGEAVQNQSIQLDSVYRQHLRDLQLMLTELRTQQDELGATMEERLSKMRDMSLSAKVGAESLTEASIKGRETVEALNEAASLTDTAVEQPVVYAQRNRAYRN